MTSVQEETQNHKGQKTREELRELVWPEKEEARKAFDVRYLRLFGTSAGLLLSQLVYWTGKGHDPDGFIYKTTDGFIYKTKEQIIAEVGLGTIYEVDQARHRLEDEGVLESKKRPRRGPDGRVKHPSPVLHYRVNLIALAVRLGLMDLATLTHDSKPATIEDSDTRESQVRIREGRALESGKVGDSYTESTYRDYETEKTPKESMSPTGAENEFSAHSASPFQEQNTGRTELVKDAVTEYLGLLKREGVEQAPAEGNYIAGIIKLHKEHATRPMDLGCLVEALVAERLTWHRDYDGLEPTWWDLQEMLAEVERTDYYFDVF